MRGGIHVERVLVDGSLDRIGDPAAPADVLPRVPVVDPIRLHDGEHILAPAVEDLMGEVVAFAQVLGPPGDRVSAAAVGGALADPGERVVPGERRHPVVGAVLVDELGHARRRAPCDGKLEVEDRGAHERDGERARGEHRRRPSSGQGQACGHDQQRDGAEQSGTAKWQHGGSRSCRLHPVTPSAARLPHVRPVALRPLLAEGLPLSGADLHKLAADPPTRPQATAT